MAFQQGLSGLNASSTALDVIGNNIANSSTVGFKAANAHFADVYASMMAGSGASQIGIGTTVMAIQQEFTQGNVTTTKNPLDIAINGDGFFRMSSSGALYKWEFNIDGKLSERSVSGPLTVNHSDTAMRAALDGAGIMQHMPPAVVGCGHQLRDVGVSGAHLLQRDDVGTRSVEPLAHPLAEGGTNAVHVDGCDAHEVSHAT